MAKHGLHQVYNRYVNMHVFGRKLWSLSMVPRGDIIKTYLKIMKDVPEWEEDNEEDHGYGEMLNQNYA